MTHFQRSLLSISVPVAVALQALAFFALGQQASCASRQLTAQEASAQVDVACVLLARALSHGDAEKVERLVAQACASDHVRSVMERALMKIESERQKDAGADFLLEAFPASPDGGSK